MQKIFLPTATRGMSLIEALIGSALILIVFLAIFGTYQLALTLVFSTKAASGASALINQRIEYIRGLDYDAIGTVGGIPSGAIVQSELVNLNGVPYTVSTLIQYVDDPTDGLDALDETGVTADYKLVRVSAHWIVRGISRSTFAMTHIAPNGIETLADGGTLRVNVFNLSAAVMRGAPVRIVNPAANPAVDVTITTGASGSVVFPGTPPASGYQVTVTKDGYSTAQTYSATPQNPNPSPGHVAVVDDTTTTLSLEINQNGSLEVSTWNPPGTGSFFDAFTNQSQLTGTTSATVSGGSLHLDGGPGSYPSLGSAASIPIAPTSLSSWDSFSWNASTSPEASASIQLWYFNGTSYVLIPDEDVPGNSAGLSSSPVDLSGLPAATYGTLQIRADLTSVDPEWTPEILNWNIDYAAGPTPLPNADFLIHGTRTIGVASGGEPIYKVDEEHTTTQYGTWILTPLEPDGYTLSVPSGSPYAIADQCPANVGVSPGQAAAASLTLVPATTHSLRVSVVGGGASLQGASVTLQGNSVNETYNTSTCGQTFFSGIPSGTYTLTVSAPGYQTLIDTAAAVSGATLYSATLVP